MALIGFKEGKKDEWFLEFRCNNHISGNKDWFSQLDENFRHKVKFRNDARIVIWRKATFEWL